MVEQLGEPRTYWHDFLPLNMWTAALVPRDHCREDRDDLAVYKAAGEVIRARARHDKLFVRLTLCRDKGTLDEPPMGWSVPPGDGDFGVCICVAAKNVVWFSKPQPGLVSIHFLKWLKRTYGSRQFVILTRRMTLLLYVEYCLSNSVNIRQTLDAVWM